MSSNNQWYTNKDLFELINSLQAEMRERLLNDIMVFMKNLIM